MQTELRIELSLKDRAIETYTCTQPEVIVGRDPAADIVIDNPGISRHHMKFAKNEGGTYIVTDLGSKNGIFLNGDLIQEEPVRNNDVLVLGKFTMRVKIEKEGAPRRAQPEARPSDDIDGTTVLSKEQMARMMADVKLQSPAAAAAAPARKTPASAPPEKASGLPFEMLIIGGIILLIIATVFTFFVL